MTPDLLLVAASLVLLFVGGKGLVRGSVNITRVFDISDAVIGLPLVAVRTSLPELATAVTAAIRRHSDVGLGNVIGSNIFNILAILCTTAVILLNVVSERFREFDAHVMIAVNSH